MTKRRNRIWLFKKSIALVYFMIFLFTRNIDGQSLEGITGKPDTSYTTYSAWVPLKNNPEITIVQNFNFSDVIEKKGITYCTMNHRNLLIDAFMPKEKTSNKRIAVIMIHGGGWRSGNRSQHYPLAESLAHLGYVCFTPEYRLSTEALFPAAVYDIKAAIRWVNECIGLQCGYVKNHNCRLFSRW